MNISLIEIPRSCFLSSAYLTVLFGLRISAVFSGLEISIPFPIQARPVFELKDCSYHLNIGQDQLNIALTM